MQSMTERRSTERVQLFLNVERNERNMLERNAERNEQRIFDEQ